MKLTDLSNVSAGISKTISNFILRKFRRLEDHIN